LTTASFRPAAWRGLGVSEGEVSCASMVAVALHDRLWMYGRCKLCMWVP
jgi:hypothetical protein